MLKVKSSFKPTGDQPKAIEALAEGVRRGLKNQVLLGVTGSGKTFTIAKVIERLQLPTLIIAHNKTLSAQLYQEMREFFPNNAVCYFVSYYDYYQPEAYVPQKDLYIAKEAQINELIDKLRLQATTNILTRDDVVVVASVSCIYNIGSPEEFGREVVEIRRGEKWGREELVSRLVKLHYQRSEFELKRGSFRVRGGGVDIYPAYKDEGVRVRIDFEGRVEKIVFFEPVSGKVRGEEKRVAIYPAKQYVVGNQVFERVEKKIRKDLRKEADDLRKRGLELEAKRLVQRVSYDLEMMREVGYVNGIENYSRYFDGRKEGEPPFTLLDYFQYRFGERWLAVVDESHMTLPQIRGMYRGDRARKQMLVDYGFRLRAAFDNRPLKFEEFYPKVPHFIYVSATPGEWEVKRTREEGGGIVEQLVRPTGIVDPKVEIRPAQGEVEDVVREIGRVVKEGGKVLVTTLTKRMAEDLSEYLQERGVKAYYLHSDIETLERSEILNSLRQGEFEVLVGINLLREGLDLPEVALVAILEGDREGFLRSKTALIQTMGRAARNVKGRVIVYADRLSPAIREAVEEIERRRRYQLEYNRKHKITPKTIDKPIRPRVIEGEELSWLGGRAKPYFESDREFLEAIRGEELTAYDKAKVIKRLRRMMKEYAKSMNFEAAIMYRDKIRELEGGTT